MWAAGATRSKRISQTNICERLIVLETQEVAYRWNNFDVDIDARRRRIGTRHRPMRLEAPSRPACIRWAKQVCSGCLTSSIGGSNRRRTEWIAGWGLRVWVAERRLSVWIASRRLSVRIGRWGLGSQRCGRCELRRPMSRETGHRRIGSDLQASLVKQSNKRIKCN